MVTLATIVPLDPATGQRTTVRLSSANIPEACGHDDEEWFPAIGNEPDLGIRFFDGAFAEAPQLVTGTMRVELAGLLSQRPEIARFVWTNAVVELIHWQPDDAKQVFTGKVRSAGSSGFDLELALQVDDAPFDADVLTKEYAGTTGTEGHADLKGIPKPWLFGRCLNIEPVPIDLIDNVFQLSAYGPVAAIEAVYERGASFGASQGDFASYAALVAANIAEGQWGTCLAEGLFRLGAPAAGVITTDAIGDASNGTPRRTGAVIDRIADELGLGDRLDLASLVSLDGAVPYNIGLYLTEQTSLLDLAHRLALPCNAVAGVDWNARLFVSRVVLGSPQLTLDAQGTSLPSVTDMTEQGVSPPFKRIVMGAERAWRVHTFDEIAFAAQLIELGPYDANTEYREGNIVAMPSGSRYLYVSQTPGNTAEPGTDNTVWRLLSTASSLNPTGDYSAAATYYPGDLVVWTDGNSYSRIGTGSTTGVAPNDGTKWALFLEGGGGAPGQDGIDGADGLLVEYAFKRAAARPATPTGNGIPATWSDDPPADDGNPLWMTKSKQELDGTLVGTWSLPIEFDGRDGVDGLPGYSRATIQIFTRSATQPALPSNTLTYDFPTDTLTGLNNGWQRTLPAENGNPAWTTFLDFFGNTDTDTVDPANIPAAVGLPGGGADGVTFIAVRLFKRSATLPAVPSDNVIVDLATGAVSGQLDGWTVDIPAPNGNGDPVYTIGATAFGTTGNDAIPPSEWETPVIALRDGEDGNDGASTFTLLPQSNVRVGTNWVEKISGGAAWNAPARSAESYTGGCSGGFEVTSLAHDFLIGMNNDILTGASFARPDFAIFQNNSVLKVVHSGVVYHTEAEPLVLGDFLSWEFDGKRILYKKNGQTFVSYSFANATTAFFLDIVIYSGRVDNIVWASGGSSGDDGYSISVTGPANIAIPCDANGAPKAGAYDNTGGVVELRKAGVLLESGVTYLLFETSACSVSLNTSTGAYALTAIGADTAYFRLRCTHDGQTFEIKVPAHKVLDGAPANRGSDTGGVSGNTSYTEIVDAELSAPAGATVAVTGFANYSCTANNTSFSGRLKIVLQNVTDNTAEADLVEGAEGTTATRTANDPGNGEIEVIVNPGSASSEGSFTVPTTGSKLYRARLLMRRANGNTGSISGDSVLTLQVQ